MKSEQIIENLKDCKQFFKEYALSYALENGHGLLPSGKSAELIFTIEDAVCELERLIKINKRLYVSNNHKTKHVEQLMKERDEARGEAFELRDYSFKFDKMLPWEEGSE